MDFGTFVTGCVVGVILGLGFAWSRVQALRVDVARLETEREHLHAERKVIDEARTELATTFRAVGAEALDKSNQTFLQLAEQRFKQLLTEQQKGEALHEQNIQQLVKPMRELLDKQNEAVGALERKRENAYTELLTHMQVVTVAHDKLASETGRLVSALARPMQRGRWGELQLERVVELAGMTKHCDFSTQVHVRGDDGSIKPDLVVHLPRGREIVVDAKTPIEAYLAAQDPNANREERLAVLARHMRDHVRALSSKQYWAQFERTPDVLVMFVPVESALSAAMEVDPSLHADALESQVLIATPTVLIAVLRAVAYGWQQEDIAQNAHEIARVGAELYERAQKFAEHFTKIGTSLGASVRNQAVGSFEGRLLVSARKLRELGATSAEELSPPDSIEHAVRELAAVANDNGA